VDSNIEIAERIYDAWGQGDFSGSDWAAPEFELVAVDGPTTGHAVGMDAAAKLWSEVLSAWEDFRTLVEEFVPINDDCLLVLTTNSGRGKSSGMNVGTITGKGANVLYIRNGKVTKLLAYWDREAALADLGR